MGRLFSKVSLGLVASLLLSAVAGAAPTSEPGPLQDTRTAPWAPEIVELFATLPVQDRGRVKPMDSMAGLRMLMLNGKRSLKVDDVKLGPTEWLLDVLFFPEQASDYPSFRIQNDAVLVRVGLDTKKKRDWYSYNELLPARKAIFDEAQRVNEKDRADMELDVVDQQVRKLDNDLFRFAALAEMLEPLRIEFATDASPGMALIWGPGKTLGAYGVIDKHEEFLELSNRAQTEGGPDLAGSRALMTELGAALDRSRMGPTIFPPPENATDTETWWNLSEVVGVALSNHIHDHVDLVGLLQDMEQNKHEQAAFLTSLRAFHGKVEGMAVARGEYKHIAKEVSLYKLKPFFWSLMAFFFAFLMLAVSFLSPKLRSLQWGSFGFNYLGLGMLTIGIVMRCIIRERPPVVSLYDTILFVTGVIVLLASIAEHLTRQRVALTAATVLGVIGMFLAGRYEFKEVLSSGDTMASVVAVLDTNYYLAIHVTTIAMGYAGGLLAGALGYFWILAKLVRFKQNDRAFYRGISRMTYGVVCFCLLFAIFGTVMGGVWANDSWGRFWGWDPKENGALLICIWMLLILHMRLGGYIKQRGLAVMTVFGSAIVSFSWWHVNMLEVGLHSYGKISGIFDLLMLLYGLTIAVAAVSGIDHLIRRSGGTPA